MHCLARETIASNYGGSLIGCSHELGNEFVLEVLLFRTNKSHLYFVNNDWSFHMHSKHFTKVHQFIDNNNFFKLNNAWLIFDMPFFANFSHIQKSASEFEH